ncbi:sensor histidine kinase [Amycolatopsis saalfeldensis]|uniref:histidine kinase n=1 Tax=Amycolatopsis saalfeldensis TaxID=394193 RepID=A0A1H8XG53_9PSEU|nr:HAMP domain-containing sensor histidine kinase [Amycolatopsis saalfeldensis]SEP38849.1 two-component system, OmpR family, sensor kinase [Amycolatopsis saalfeldensis]
MSRERLRWLVRGRLRLRVLVPVVSVTLVALVAFDLAAVTALRSYLMGQTDTSLSNAAQAVRPQLNELPPGPELPPGADVMHHPDAIGKWIDTHHFLVGMYSMLYIPQIDGAPDFRAAIADEDGPPTPAVDDHAPNVPVDLAGLVVDGRTQDTVSALGDPLRSIALRGPNGTLVISTSLSDADRIVDRMRLIVALGSAAAVLLIGLAVFWLLRRGFRPIETMAAQADRITAGDLTDRVTPQDPSGEVGRLGAALNGMLARIEASVQEREAGQELMRRFFADASHELRTPLASLRANAELYQQGALPERAQVDEVMRRIGLEARRMSGLVDDMLRLARLDQHPDRQREPVDLSGLVTGRVEAARVAAPGHRWRAEIAGGVVVVGDEELVRRAVDNLLANVRAHTPEGTAATVTLSEHGDTVEIEVADTGPGVSAGRLPRIFDRFYRADTTARGRGSGLGLAIVTQIATVHNGSVTAGPNEPHGLRVKLTLPTALTRDSHDSPAEF